MKTWERFISTSIYERYTGMIPDEHPKMSPTPAKVPISSDIAMFHLQLTEEHVNVTRRLKGHILRFKRFQNICFASAIFCKSDAYKEQKT